MVELQDWEKAVLKFLEGWKDKPYVIGALVTGSYAIGRQTKYSDVDVHIVLSDKVKWRERGNKFVDGFLIEWFANPVQQLKKYRAKDYSENRRTDARMYAIGTILLDKAGDVAKLKASAIKRLKQKFKKPNKGWLVFAKYRLWDGLDGLKDSFERNGEEFEIFYFNFLKEILDTYSKFVGAEMIPLSKLARLLRDESFRKDYAFDEFPDKHFVQMFLQCINEKYRNEKMKSIEHLVNYCHQKMGGFDIEQYKFRSPVEK